MEVSGGFDVRFTLEGHSLCLNIKLAWINWQRTAYLTATFLCGL